MKNFVLILTLFLLASSYSLCQMTGGGESKKVIVIEQKDKGHFFIAAQLFGGKIGYMHKFGANLSVGGDLTDKNLSILLGLSKSIVRTGKIQWNIYPLAGLVDSYYEEYYDDGYTSSEGFFFAIGGGMDFSYTHLYLNLDVYTPLEGDRYPHVMTGIGWRF